LSYVPKSLFYNGLCPFLSPVPGRLTPTLTPAMLLGNRRHPPM